MRRSMLFLPGNNPNMLINGNCLGADAVIFDLEDAVSPAEKDAARILVRNTMKYMDFSGCEMIVRINSIDTLLDQEFKGHHQAERVQNSEVSYVRYLIGRIVKTYDYINRVVLTLPLSVYEGTWTTLSPLVAMHHHDLACA